MASARRSIVLVLLVGTTLPGFAQSASDACSYAVTNQYPVTSSCALLPFNKPAGYAANYDPASCGSDAFGDAFGWFQATAAITTITYDPAAANRDPILHVLTGPCGGPYAEVVCVDDGLDGDNETVTFPTVPGNNYLFRLQHYYGSQQMNGSVCVFNPPPPAPACGTTVYDPGGSAANYASNTDFTATYCPAVVGQQVTLTFTTFNTENGYDFVTLYDGPTTASPLIGTWSGTNTPGVITSTNPSGCITLHFESDGITNRPGWAANVTCGTPPPPLYVCGTTIYDVGGAAGNYTNNQNTVVTYCPVTPGHVVSLNFSAFSVTAPDVLTIYDGPSISSPVLNSFAGTGLPGVVTATNPGGCITLRFFSNANTVSTGWAAALTCAPPPPPPAGDCVYALNLNDANGNGWGSSSVGVSINAGPFTYYSVTGTARQVLIGVYIGDLVALDYVATGPNQGQNSFALSMQGQTTICSGGPSPTAGIQCVHTVDCIPPLNPPTDCSGAFTVCNAQAFNNNSDNSGNTEDLAVGNQGCLASGERQGTWYFFSPSTVGTVGFTLTPTVPTDYDFAVWGPYAAAACPPAGPPLRCSYGLTSAATGLGNSAVDLSEGAIGDGWVQPISVAAGDIGKVYILYVDNFSSNGQSFNLSWASTSSLDCTVLPVSLSAFDAYPLGAEAELVWTTASERNSDHFDVERSLDGLQFTRIGTVQAMGNSLSAQDYAFIDPRPIHGMNYYRLRHVDVDGATTLSDIRPVLMRSLNSTLVPVPNPGSHYVDLYASDVEPGSVLSLLDVTGREVVRHPIQNDRTTVDTADLPRGLYIFRVQTAAGAICGHVTWVKE